MTWLAWTAHAYTGLGVVAALLAMLEVIDRNFRGAFIWLGVQIAIDATDGVLARALRVKQRLPHFDGARLDDIIDYVCYTFIPVVLVLRAELLNGGTGVAVCAMVLVASAYGFSQSAAKVKTRDYFFTGFPSYWNLVAFYLYELDQSSIFNAAVLTALAVLVFVPLRYVYPSRTQTMSALTNGFGVLWGILLVWLVWRLPVRENLWTRVSLAFPAYYMALSLWLHLRTTETIDAEPPARGA